ncbi:MAG: D-alanine-D-alanine ligase [Enterobacterales bacterium]|jgi:D-alanine-D-alanine ligase
MNVNSNNIDFGKVAVLLGGSSGEREVSLRSGAAIVQALKIQNVDVHAIDAAVGVIEQLSAGQFSRVFIALHGKGGEDGVIQGTLETMGLPYTGSGVMGSAIGMDKLRSKQIWNEIGLTVIPSVVVKATQVITETAASQMLVKLGKKVMVKPSAEGSSLGIAMAKTTKELLEAISGAAIFGGEVIIEQWINGPEFTVSILGDRTLPVVQIKPAREFYDYTAKYTASGTEYFCPANITKDEENLLKDMALKAFDAINCSGWGRVDFIQNKSTGKFYLLEVNTVPGMTESSLVPIAAKAAKISFKTLVLEILKTSMTQQKIALDIAND